MRRWLLPAAIVVLLLAGCGGGDGGGDAATGADTAAATATTPSSAAALASTTANQPPAGETDRISSCLTALGYKLTGGATQIDDPDAADYQIVLDSPRGGGYIGFYKNVSRAERVVKQLRKNASRVSGAAAESHGAVNIVWVDLPDSAARTSVRACLVD